MRHKSLKDKRANQSSLPVIVVAQCSIFLASANCPHSPYPLVGYTAAKQDMAYEVLRMSMQSKTLNIQELQGSRVLPRPLSTTVSRGVVRSSGEK
jgi:hypothetical protein